MEPFILSRVNSVANNFLAEIRDKEKQKDSLRLRNNFQRLGEILAYELSKELAYSEEHVITSLGVSEIQLLKNNPVLITIMRAGIPFYQGFLNFFDKSESGFIGASRSGYDEDMEFDIDMGYLAVGDINNKEVIIIDPMIATGKSLKKAVDQLLHFGKPDKIHIAGLIASRSGLNFLLNEIKIKTQYWFCSIDEELNDKSYIVPGLGDAGDLCFGKKL